jgi:hypothetical protein
MAGIFGVVAALGIGGGLAHAEPDFTVYGNRGDQNGWTYASELRHQGLIITDQGAAELGSQLCNQITLRGITERQLRWEMEDQYSIHMTVAIVSGATYHFCPWNEEIVTPPPAPPAPVVVE